MAEFRRFNVPEERREKHLDMVEKLEAQNRLMEFMGKTDTPGRAEWIGENSSAFRELWEDPEFKELISEGNLEEAKKRLETFKREQREAA